MLQKVKKEDYDSVFEIMSQSFSEDEYRSYHGEKELFQHDNYYTYVYKDNEKDIIKGFISLWEFEDFIYIEHFATAKDFRNQGIGGKILRNLVEIAEKTICLEVEPPEDESSQRRINFYKRNGFHLNDYDYVQPPLREDGRPLNFLIMSSDEYLDQDQFETVRKTLYKELFAIKE